ncbi:MAG: hypothetical protein AAFV86_13960 [Pseudomonadota bacterium]
MPRSRTDFGTVMRDGLNARAGDARAGDESFVLVLDAPDGDTGGDAGGDSGPDVIAGTAPATEAVAMVMQKYALFPHGSAARDGDDAEGPGDTVAMTDFA